MIIRLFVGAGLFALGFYVGKQLGRTESVLEQLRLAREEGSLAAAEQKAVADVDGKKTTSAVESKDKPT